MRGYPQFGPLSKEIGADISDVSPIITSPIHHVITTAILSTLTPPQAMLGFIGPTYLIADSLFSWTTAGNIGAVMASTLTAGSAMGFVYDKSTGKWYPIGNTK